MNDISQYHLGCCTGGMGVLTSGCEVDYLWGAGKEWPGESILVLGLQMLGEKHSKRKCRDVMGRI